MYINNFIYSLITLKNLDIQAVQFPLTHSYPGLQTEIFEEELFVKQEGPIGFSGGNTLQYFDLNSVA